MAVTPCALTSSGHLGTHCPHAATCGRTCCLSEGLTRSPREWRWPRGSISVIGQCLVLWALWGLLQHVARTRSSRPCGTHAPRVTFQALEVTLRHFVPQGAFWGCRLYRGPTVGTWASFPASGLCLYGGLSSFFSQSLLPSLPLSHCSTVSPERVCLTCDLCGWLGDGDRFCPLSPCLFRTNSWKWHFWARGDACLCRPPAACPLESWCGPGLLHRRG